MLDFRIPPHPVQVAGAASDLAVLREQWSWAWSSSPEAAPGMFSMPGSYY